jgi:putative toxin-antitoxin system antitoxin component (TIGR02293 family)
MDIFTLAKRPYQELIPIIRQGLPAHTFSDVAHSLNIPISILASNLHVRIGMVIRRQSSGKPLSLEDSEKVIRIARIRNLAHNIFISDDAIGNWLTQPSPALDGIPPLDWLETEIGTRRVEALLRSDARLRNPDNGRLDANLIADLLGLSLPDIARSCGVSKQSLNQNPASPGIQTKLQSLDDVAQALLLWCGDNEAKLRDWLNRPNRDFPELNGQTPSPRDLILRGHPELVTQKIHNLRTGHPS